MLPGNVTVCVLVFIERYERFIYYVLCILMAWRILISSMNLFVIACKRRLFLLNRFNND